jgi:hypothetical protein
MAVPGTFTAGQVLTAAEMNALPGGILGFDENSTDVALTTSATEITAITVDVFAGRSYGVFFTGRNMSVAQINTIIDFELNITGGATLTQFRKFMPSTTARDSVYLAFVDQPASDDAAREYTVDVQTSTGTGTLFGNAYPIQMWVVDLGENP